MLNIVLAPKELSLIHFSPQRNLIFVLAILLLGGGFNITTISAQAPKWSWVNGIGGIEREYSGTMTTDSQGNVFVSGVFESPQMIVGTDTLINSSTDIYGGVDVFVIKYDLNGNPIWARKFGKAGSEESEAITVDASGDIYIGGFFYSDTLYFGNDTLVNGELGRGDFFIVKYDSNGNELWARSVPNLGNDEITSMCIDQTGNLYCTGRFSGETIQFGTIILDNPVLYRGNMFIVKYTPSGNLIWAETVEGSSDVTGTSISADPYGNIFIGGGFRSHLIIGTDTMLFAGLGDLFLAKYDTTGTPLWTRRFGGERFDYCHSIATDSIGNVCIVGTYSSDSLVFDSYTIMKNGVFNMFAVNLDNNGNVKWAKTAGGIDNAAVARTVTADPAGDYFVGGRFYAPTLVLGSDTLMNYDTLHHNDFFIVKYTSSGAEIWSKSGGGEDNDEIYDLSTDIYGNVYAFGRSTSNSMALDSIFIVNNSIDVFVGQIGPQIMTNIIEEYLAFPKLVIYPNPSTSYVNIQFSYYLTNAELSVYDLKGQKVLEIGNISGQDIMFNIDKLITGTYFTIVTQNEKIIGSAKMIVMD